MKAYIFDFDGVLANSEPFHTYACIKAGQMCGLEISLDIYKKYATPGASLIDIATGLMEYYKKPELIDKYIESKKSLDSEYQNQVQIFPGAREAIVLLADKYSLAICSGTRYSLIDLFLSKYDLHSYFNRSQIITSEDISKSKPNPEGYLLTLKRLNLSCIEAVVIEDGENGIIASKDAGIFAIGITNTTSKKRLLDAGANQVIANLNELMVPIST